MVFIGLISPNPKLIVFTRFYKSSLNVSPRTINYYYSSLLAGVIEYANFTMVDGKDPAPNEVACLLWMVTQNSWRRDAGGWATLHLERYWARLVVKEVQFDQLAGHVKS